MFYTSALKNISNILLALFFSLFIFSTLGLHLFKGNLENRCRSGVKPFENNTWPPITPYLCGIDKCPENSTCSSLEGYNISPGNESEIPTLNYGFSNYDNFYNSLLTNLHCILFTGLSSVNDIVLNFS